MEIVLRQIDCKESGSSKLRTCSDFFLKYLYYLYCPHAWRSDLLIYVIMFYLFNYLPLVFVYYVQTESNEMNCISMAGRIFDHHELTLKSHYRQKCEWFSEIFRDKVTCKLIYKFINICLFVNQQLKVLFTCRFVFGSICYIWLEDLKTLLRKIFV